MLVGVAWATVGLWLVGAWWTVRNILRRKNLDPAADDAPGATGAGAPPRPQEVGAPRDPLSSGAPLVSVLVPARDEEHRVLAAAVRSMLAQDWPALEVIAVNDRSTDATGAILHALAREDARLRVVEGREPPAGWFGKPHALQQALAEARGPWVLATDADVIFDRRAVRTALALALGEACDAVTLLPRVECLSFWERVFMPAFGWFMLVRMPLARINRPDRREALGVGGFFLVRREALERVGAYAAVRAEVAEDLRMAEILKGGGARLRAEFAPALVRTRMQTGFAEIWEGFTKNLFAGTKFSPASAFLGAGGVLLFSVAPPLVALACAALAASGAGGALSRLLLAPTLAVWLIQAATFAALNRRWGVPARYALAVPLAHALFVAILLNSSLRILRGSGVTWKGRKLYERAGPRPARVRGRASDPPFADE